MTDREISGLLRPLKWLNSPHYLWNHRFSLEASALYIWINLEVDGRTRNTRTLLQFGRTSDVLSLIQVRAFKLWWSFLAYESHYEGKTFYWLLLWFFQESRHLRSPEKRISQPLGTTLNSSFSHRKLYCQWERVSAFSGLSKYSEKEKNDKWISACCSKHLQWVRTMKADQDEEYVLVKREPPKPSKTPSTADPSVKQAVFSLCDQLGLDNVARRSVTIYW